jgi:hypothetical protein
LTVGAIRKVEGKRNAAVVARIPVTVEAGYHVNSNAPLEDYLIPLKVAWNSTGALEGGEVIYPKASTEKYEFADKPLSVFAGSFEIAANFKVAAGAPAGPGIAAGKLSYQACNAKMCFRPATVEISIPYQVD